MQLILWNLSNRTPPIDRTEPTPPIRKKNDRTEPIEPNPSPPKILTEPNLSYPTEPPTPLRPKHRMGYTGTWGKATRRTEPTEPNPLHLRLTCEPARPLQSLRGLSGPKCRKNLENVSWGLRPRNPEKSPKTRNSLGNLGRVSRKCRKSLFGLFPRLFGDFSRFRGRRLRETFSRRLWHFGPERPL